MVTISATSSAYLSCCHTSSKDEAVWIHRSEPLSSSIFSLAERICHSCFRRQEKLQKCSQCKFAHYCDRTCQRAGWAEHKLECGAVKAFGKAPNENIR